MDIARLGSFPSRVMIGSISHLRLKSRIDGVKVRRIMIVEIHTDHDAKEATDFWHDSNFTRTLPHTNVAVLAFRQSNRKW